jgi:trimethylamine--corrinoid protein Co-methyltransferase
MLNYTAKPIVFVTTEFSGCVDAVEMAEAVAGGTEALRRNPMGACYINVTTGLRHNEEALQKLLYLAGKGLPALCVPVALGGATAPITLAGCQVIWNVGALVGLVLSQLKREGAPYIVTGWGGQRAGHEDAHPAVCRPRQARHRSGDGPFLWAVHVFPGWMQ